MILKWQQFNETIGFALPVKWISDLIWQISIGILEDADYEEGEIGRDIVLEYKDLEPYIHSNKEEFIKYPVEKISFGFSAIIDDDFDYEQTGGYSFLSKEDSTSQMIPSQSGLTDKAVHLKFYIDLNLPEDPQPRKFYQKFKESIYHEVTHGYEDYRRTLTGQAIYSDQIIAIVSVEMMSDKATNQSLSVYNLFHDIYTSTGIESRAIIGQILPGIKLRDLKKSFAWDRFKSLKTFNGDEYANDITEHLGSRKANNLVNRFVDKYEKECQENSVRPNKSILNLKNQGIQNFCNYWDKQVKDNFEKYKRKLYKKVVK